jgi:integrase
MTVTTIITGQRSEEGRESRALGSTRRELPGILVGASTPTVEGRARKFYNSVADMFETWIARRSSDNTRAAYRRDVLSFVEWADIRWPQQATELLTVGVGDVQSYRDYLVEIESAPSTINRRLCSLSSFYKYLREIASEK